jgi:diguanylate cyclase (GGDEF)-like protein
MPRKQAAQVAASERVKAFLLGFRWLALVLDIVLLYANCTKGSLLVPSSTAAQFSNLVSGVIVVLLIYHAGATFLFLRLLDQRSSLYMLLVLDTIIGALVTYFCGPDSFLLAYTLPVIEATYFLGGFWGTLLGILIGCVYFLALGTQMVAVHHVAESESNSGLYNINQLRWQMAAGYSLVTVAIAWLLSAWNAEESDFERERRKVAEEKTILFRELDTTKEESRAFCNKLAERETMLAQIKQQYTEASDDLEKSLKRVHEIQYQYQAAQQVTQQKEQKLMSAHKRELEEYKREMEEYQKSLDQSTRLLDAMVSVNASVHRDQAVMNIIEHLIRLVPAQTCLLYSLETQDGEQQLYPDGGASPYLELLRHSSIKIGEGAVGWVAKHREPIRIDKEQAQIAGEELSAIVHYEKSALIAPLEFDGRLLGVLYLGRAPASAFSQEEFDITVQFARLASSTFNNALVYQRTLSVGIFDDVTGLYNALYFDERLTEEVKRARRYQFPLSLILLDVDNFTRFNDMHGHTEGNQLLKDVAEILKEHTRETDVLSRLENDEFAVLLVESEKNNAILIGERIRMALEVRYLGRQPQQRKVHITVSGGIATFPAEADSREQLVEKSAAALRQARKKGGNVIGYAQ